MTEQNQTQYDDPVALMRSIIQRVATGPELSKDISREEAAGGMRAVLDNRVDPVQAAIFLIALRMKRETDEENTGVLDALLEATHRVEAEVDEVVALSDPYDGYNRTIPASPFLPAVLAACGVAVVSEGVESMGPKYGVTHKRVLRAAGREVDLSPEEAAARLADPAVGWAYVDQSRFCPSLYALQGLRDKMIKRTVLTTLEVLQGPIRGRRATRLVTGYVHKPYPRIYSLLARHSGFDSLLLVRGVEGGVTPSLRQAGKCVFYHDRGEEQDMDLDPRALGIEQTVRAAPLPEELPKAPRAGDEIAVAVDIDAMVEVTARMGMAALEGEAGPIRDGLVYSGALVLHHLGRFGDLAAAADEIRRVLDDGSARTRFLAG
ncbi:MAG TPA: anthranilate phosphoribosyltransferase [Thiotrichales bacterium]|nr:anthranilate phosphoribosyltransferase [Thiotrichales bacterium]